MISTVSAEKIDIDESLSTCRFAQRVALIKNEYRVNEEVDDKLMIKRLKKEVDYLKNEIRLLKGDTRGPLSLTEKEDCEELINTFISTKESDMM